MNLKTYQKEAKRTCPSLGHPGLDLSHMVMGMMTEVRELEDAIDSVNISEELADIMWYFVNYLTFRKIDLDTLVTEVVYFPALDLAYSYFADLQDYIKKNIAYGKEIPAGQELKTLRTIFWWVIAFHKEVDLDFERGLQNNIDKLRVRFPEKFTKNKAINRDLDSERKELEK